MKLTIFCDPEGVLNEKWSGISEKEKILFFRFLKKVLNSQPWYLATIKTA
jgi:hypothetical protein